ncbi:hypothetical protein PR202_ga06398 [Eleusine coracana subsp. coracana]|uniref:Uncharacterized protein n=1 Tax=Eleusine coracana subsp. coracana TaxID=191504 RepID=A0AAV5BWL2_ELECO|nr:hypothetical protein PR202_ga06398 [Eleusine coracana subsp. coracana]
MALRLHSPTPGAFSVAAPLPVPSAASSSPVQWAVAYSPAPDVATAYFPCANAAVASSPRRHRRATTPSSAKDAPALSSGCPCASELRPLLPSSGCPPSLSHNVDDSIFFSHGSLLSNVAGALSFVEHVPCPSFIAAATTAL